MATEIAVVGTKEEKKLFTDVYRHYVLADQDLRVRIPDFDKKDILFRSYIEEGKWPYRAQVFDPRIFTALFEKTARILANKPRGRMVPREGGDSLGAKINNELLDFQWDENERIDGTPMLAKWALMDMTARKYGASFALCKWQYERKIDDNKKPYVCFDGPNFRPLNNRDCLPNPSYSTIKNWFQHRDYPTLQELMQVNDAARSKPIYKNLDLLRQALRENAKQGGDTRDTNYTIKNKVIKGLTDFLGQDEVYKTVEVITEYREDRWITFAPKHGVILRDIPNPYKHGQIPVVMLKYYPIDDDLYGLSEIESVEKLQRALNAYLCQNLDTLNMSTYTPLKVRSTGGAVQMHTLNFGPGSFWLMNDPATDVLPFELNPQGVAELVPTYRLITGAIAEGLGEASATTSSLDPGQGDKTATEIKDLAIRRSARDNFNQLFLGEAIKKQMMLWHLMNRQFMFSNPKEQQKVIRIVGKDAIKYFQGQGLSEMGLTEEATNMLSSPEMVDPMAQGIVNPEDLQAPMYPVNVNGETIPKFNLSEDGQYGELILEPEDLSGTYDYIPDVASMRIPDEAQILNAQNQLIEIILNPVTTQLLAQEQYKIKVKEVIEDHFEQLGIKDADKYFEKLQVNSMMNGQIDPQTGQPIVAAGGAGPQGLPQGMVNGGVGGMAGSGQAVPNGQAQPVIPRPIGV